MDSVPSARCCKKIVSYCKLQSCPMHASSDFASFGALVHILASEMKFHKHEKQWVRSMGLNYLCQTDDQAGLVTHGHKLHMRKQITHQKSKACFWTYQPGLSEGADSGCWKEDTSSCWHCILVLAGFIISFHLAKGSVELSEVHELRIKHLMSDEGC